MLGKAFHSDLKEEAKQKNKDQDSFPRGGESQGKTKHTKFLAFQWFNWKKVVPEP